MGYAPENNPYIPGDPYSYDLAWMVEEVKKAQGIEAASDENRKQAEAWAVGTIDGIPVTSDEPQYHNSSKYWSDDSFVSAEQSEAWAVGTIQGIPVTADKDQYENNSKYYANAAASSASDAADDAADAHADMLTAKDYADNIADPVSGIVTAWLNDHITNPSSPPVDTSLTVGGAAADAKVTGDIFNEITDTYQINTYTEINPDTTHAGNRFYYNSVYSRIAQASANAQFGFYIYPVTAGRYRIHGHGYDTDAGVFAAVGDADIIADNLSYCTLLQIIDVGGSDPNDYAWHTIEADINQSGFLYVNYKVGDLPVVESIGSETHYIPTKNRGIIKNGSSYVHYCYSHDGTYILRTIEPYGANGLYDIVGLSLGHFDNGAMLVDSVIWSSFTDQIGPVSLHLQSNPSEPNRWTGGAHTINIGGVDYPTAQLNNLHVYVDGIDITNEADGYYEGDARIVAEDYLYAPETITGADLSQATLAIIETRTFILTDTLKVQVKLNFQEDLVIGLYYGMQCQDGYADKILLPTAGLELVRSSMTSGAITDSKEWNIMLFDNNGWHYDLKLAYYGLGSWDKNDGTSTYGRISHYAASKIYYVLCSGGRFVQNTIFFWEGEYGVYHN